MKTYQVESKDGLIVKIPIFIAVCAAPSVIALYKGVWWIGVLFSLLMLTAAVIATWQNITSITVHDNGAVTFRRLVGGVTTPGDTIYSLVGERTSEYDGETAWAMLVLFHSECIKVSFFRSVPNFVEDIRRLNPKVTIRGEWPMHITDRDGRASGHT